MNAYICVYLQISRCVYACTCIQPPNFGGQTLHLPPLSSIKSSNPTTFPKNEDHAFHTWKICMYVCIYIHDIFTYIFIYGIDRYRYNAELESKLFAVP